MITAYALLLAAGRGVRYDRERDKLWEDLNGDPVWLRSALAFERHPRITGIVLAANDSFGMHSGRLSKLKAIVPGGATRAESCAHGMAAVPTDSDYTLVHDAARPLVSDDLISRLLDAAQISGAAAPAIAICDTIKQGNMNGPIEATVSRERLFTVQTPQVFATSSLRHALDRARISAEEFTDDAAVMEAAGQPVTLVPGDPRNIKITNPADLDIARLLDRPYQPEQRNGVGYDIHRFELGRKLVLGGVEFPYDKGLSGHSDADVLTHAICDALLGAAGQGDIGIHFPNSDPAFKDASSLMLLRHVARMLAQAGWRIVNIDATVIAEAPPIAPRSAEMRATLADAAGISIEQINLKATTNESLGALGRGEGIASFATAAITRH